AGRGDKSIWRTRDARVHGSWRFIMTLVKLRAFGESSNSRRTAISEGINRLLRRNPAVLGVARRNSTGLLIHPTQLFDVIARHRIAFGFGINAVHARGVEAEDAPLYFIGQWFPTKTLHQLIGHFQATKGFDLPLRRAPPDRVGSPEDVVGTEGVYDHAYDICR